MWKTNEGINMCERVCVLLLLALYFNKLRQPPRPLDPPKRLYPAAAMTPAEKPLSAGLLVALGSPVWGLKNLWGTPGLELGDHSQKKNVDNSK